MAVHLTSTRPTSTGTRHIASLGRHLVRISKTTSWTNKELIVTPSEERFTTAAAFGYRTDTNFNGQKTDLIDEIRRIIGLKTSSSDWYNGHKNCFSYWTQGWEVSGQALLDPYFRTVVNPPYSTDPATVFGTGICWQALRFNIYAFPISIASSCKIYIRLFNPSWVVYDVQHYDYGPGTPVRAGSGIFLAPTSNQVSDKGSTLRYDILDSLPSPSGLDLSATGSSAEIELAAAGANTNNGFVKEVFAPAIVGRDPGSTWYCPPDGMPVSSSAFWDTNKTPSVNYSMNPRYGAFNSAEWHGDIELTSDMVKKIKTIEANGRGDFWLVIGPRLACPFSTPWYATSSTLMFSRAELRIVASMNSFNT